MTKSMSNDQLFIGIDSGTQGTKVVVLSREKKEIIAESYAPHDIIETQKGGREQDPEWWISACTHALEEALASPAVDRNQVRGIAVSGQQHGFVPLDAEGKVIRPAKLWCDTETALQCSTITERMGGDRRVLDAVGNSIAAGFTASKILWLKEQEPENYARLHTMLLPHDYMNFWLTGERKTEAGDASGTAYFDVRKRVWSEEILKSIDDSGRLESCLPELIESHEPCGILRPDLAASLGLPENVLAASGGGDNMMAAIGTGNVHKGVITASLGTSGTIYACSDVPMVDAEGELAAFCSSTGGWLPLVCTMNVTVATELIRELLSFDLDAFNTAVEKSPPGADGLLLLPYFNGERTPALPDAAATLTGMTSVNLKPENLCRAGMEGATLGLRYGLEVLERNGIIPQEIRLVGGGAKSRVWRQLTADIFNTVVVSPVTTEAGALGAALQALWCFSKQGEEAVRLTDICNDFIRMDESTRAEPDADRAAFHAEQYARFRKFDTILQRV